MFLFAPPPSSFLAVSGKRNVYVPFGRLLSFREESGECVLAPSGVVCVQEKRTETICMKASEELSVVLAAVFGPEPELVLGWTSGFMVRENAAFARLYLTPFVESRRTVDPVDTYATLSEIAGQACSENVLTLLGNLNEVMGYHLAMGQIRAGDVLFVEKRLDRPQEPAEITFTVNGVGRTCCLIKAAL